MLSFNHWFTIQYRAPACNPKHLEYKQLLCFIAFSSSRHKVSLEMIVLQLFRQITRLKTQISVSVWLSIQPTPWGEDVSAGFTIVQWPIVTSRLLAVCHLTSLQTALLRAQPMSSETLLVIGWVRCSLQAEVLGFSLRGRFVLLWSEQTDILQTGGRDTGLGQKTLKWDNGFIDGRVRLERV